MKKKRVKSKGKITTGKYRFLTYPALKFPENCTPEQRATLKQERLADIKAGRIKPIRESETITNLIMLGTNTGLNIVLQQLGGQTAYPIAIDSASIGTDNTAPTDADTDLIAPVVKDIPKATTTISTNTLVIEFFITNDELTDGDYKEFGLYCGTQIFARSIITPTYSKAANEDTLVEYTITATNS